MTANEASGRLERDDGGDRSDARGEHLVEGEYDEEYTPDDPDEAFWDESLITLLIVGGVVLLVFPEPATSATGMALISLGLLTWWFDLFG